MRSSWIWDIVLPLEVNQRVKYIKNLVKPLYVSENWFKAREKAIGKKGKVSCIRSISEWDKCLADYFEGISKKETIYTIIFDEDMGYSEFYCLREELEVISS